MNPEPQHYRIAELLQFLTLLSKEDINVSEARAVLYIALASEEPDNPSLPNVSDVSAAIGISHSGASRLLSGLSSRSIPLVFTNKQISKGRSEAFCCTESGRSFVERLLTTTFYRQIDILTGTVRPRNLYNGGVSHFGHTRTITFIGHELSLRVPLKRDGSSHWNEIIEWCHDMDIHAVNSDIPENDIEVRFLNRSLALMFICRWGLPIKILAKIEEIGAVYPN